KDVAMSARVLQLVNSSFFGMPQSITNPIDAVTYLGLDTITALVLTSQVFAGCSNTALRLETLQRLWDHSLTTGSCARAIARLEQCDRDVADHAFLAGMLHDVGTLVLASELTEELANAWRLAGKLGVPTHEAERRVLGASHAAVGAYVIGT